MRYYCFYSLPTVTYILGKAYYLYKEQKKLGKKTVIILKSKKITKIKREKEMGKN